MPDPVILDTSEASAGGPHRRRRPDGDVCRPCRPARRVLGWVAVVVSLALVVAGCGSDPDRDATGDDVDPAEQPTEAPEPDTGAMLAATPPMGWNSWNQVRCKGLDEDVVKRAADALVSHGLDEVGYRYVVVDDCWQAGERDDRGALVADPERFPSGLKALADYVHAKGLLFGLYLAPGSETCAMHWDDYPATGIGSFGHERQDAEMLASVGVDYLKYDWCRADETDGLEREETFAKMRAELDRLDRPILYSISEYGDTDPWTWAPGIAHMWRTTSDILPFWPSVASIIDSQAELYPFAGPGGWNDPDMLQVGNGTLTDVEVRSHIGMWAMLAAPLMIGTDLDDVSPEVISALANPKVVAVDQDPLGRQARRVTSDGGAEVWVRDLDGGEFAVALLNVGDDAATIGVDLDELGLTQGRWTARDLWAGSDLGPVEARLSHEVEAHGMLLLRLTRTS